MMSSWMRPVGFVALTVFWATAMSSDFVDLTILFYFNIFLHVFAAAVLLVLALVDALRPRK